jgi:putative DNA primase/helicase
MSENNLLKVFLSAGPHDAGNAECAHALFGRDYLHSDAIGWLHWTGTHWAPDGAEAELDQSITAMLKARARAAYAAMLGDDGKPDASKETIAKAALPSARHIRDCKQVFRPMVTIANINEFDSSPDLLNVANGVLNLRTGELSPHDQAQRFTYCLGTPYDAKADCSQWVDYLRMTVQDDDTLDYLQMAIGYSLTGHTREECLFYVHGPSRSGKGTFSETMLALIGNPLSIETDFQTFTAKREAGDQGFDLAPLRPARIVFASESNTTEMLNAGKVKRLTGGNYITCSFKNKNQFSYRPKFKLWLSSNHPVRADVDDDAAWGRVRVIVFPNGHLGSEDKALKERMYEPENLPGVLRWAVEGARRWYASETGLVTPIKIAEATQKARDDQDFIQSWIDECANPQPGSWASNHSVYHSYSEWCKENGVSAKSQRGLAMALQTKGYPTGVAKFEQGKTYKGVGNLGVF